MVKQVNPKGLANQRLVRVITNPQSYPTKTVQRPRQVKNAILVSFPHSNIFFVGWDCYHIEHRPYIVQQTQLYQTIRKHRTCNRTILVSLVPRFIYEYTVLTAHKAIREVIQRGQRLERVPTYKCFIVCFGVPNVARRREFGEARLGNVRFYNRGRALAFTIPRIGQQTSDYQLTI